MPKDAVLNVRLPASVKDAIQGAAAEDDRSASSLVVRVLRQWLIAQGRLPVESKRSTRRKTSR